ncbi:hypothetical protein OEA41_010235 [Lepraria neglecta]|uniref:MMS19 nucleotide excision repair protein n=1 Tax=Lepraria neglecta TaxID=209136 RepID=A0AAE0DFD6_9LECA|nr:hypothetical protein OEA41_010235 [Lepraria neglecta]
MLEHFQDLQIRPQPQRLQILELLNDLMSKHRNALKELGNESVVGITDLVIGEKDPRNLMVIFSILKVVMMEWDISGHAETLFDSVFCYFPITFRPPPDDPYGITAQDLKSRLRDCVASSSYFAPYAFPQLIDKLDSTSPNVKKDVLQTITACASSYSVTTVSNYSVTLWDSLKFEILNVQEEDLAEEALVSLQAIAIRLSRGLDSTDPKTPLARYLRPITKECNEQLHEPQQKQAKPAGQILSALGIASPVAFYLIVKTVVPRLNTLYQDADSIGKQRVLLEVLVQIMDSAIAVYGTPSILAPTSTIENPLEPFKDRLFELTSQALMSTAADEVSFRVVALKAVLRLCLLRKYLQDNEIGMAVQYFDEIVLVKDPSGKDDLKKEAIRALVELSRIKPNLIMDITFPAFMSKLPDSSLSESQDYLITLEGLAQLSVEKFVSDTLIRRLLNRLDVVLQNDGSSAYPRAILSTLHYVLGQRDLPQDPNLGSYHEKIVVGLTNRVVLASTGQAPTTALNEDATLEMLGRLSTMIVRALDGHKQRSVAVQVYSLFAEGGAFTPVPFRKDTPKSQRSTMILSTALMAGVGRLVALQYTDIDNGSIQRLLAELVRLALAEDVPAIRQAILRQIGLLTNKFLPSQETRDITDYLRNLVSGLLETTTLSENAVRVVFWEAKGLVLRLAHADEVLERLLSLLSNPECGLASARGFGLLLAPDEILSKENGASIRLLAKQKAFNTCVPTIAQDFRKADTAIKPNYLIALSGILKHMPTEVIMSEIDTILPLLLQSLDLEDSDVKAATIQSLTIISQESPKAVEGHMGSFVTRLLKSASNPKVNTASVRHNALRCLHIFPGRVKDSTLLPYRNSVTRGLLGVLDDPRRHIRKEAVECRAAWFNMDEPQSD